MSLDMEAIEERVDRATPGPWHTPGPDAIAQWEIFDDEWTVASAKAYDHDDPLSNRPGARGPGYIDPDANADFIAHAREDVPALVAEVHRLHANAAHAKANLARVLCPWPFTPHPTRIVVCTPGMPHERVFNIPWPLFKAVIGALVDGQRPPEAVEGEESADGQD